MTEETEFPLVKVGDWIRFGRNWLKVSQVYEPRRIRCKFAPDGDAYLRDFLFRDEWWEFEHPSPDGAYLPPNRRRSEGAILAEGPPFRILGVSGPLQYEHRSETVWQKHDWPHPSNPPSSTDMNTDFP